MKIYLAMSPGVTPVPCPPRVLISYFFFPKRFAHYAKNNCDVFIDSGAYSAWSRGKPIRLEAYVAYLNRWKHKATIYSNLDDIDSAKASASNQRRLEQMGFSPLAVYHSEEPLPVFEELCERYDTVCCGGVANKRGAIRYQHFDQVFEIATKTNTMVHGFGVTELGLLKAFPWYSVDSSSWARPLRFGKMPLFDPRKGSDVNVDTTQLRSLMQHRELLREVYDAEPRQLLHSKAPRLQIAALSIKSWLILEEWLTKREQRLEATA